MRATGQRIEDAKARLARESNVWLATASEGGVPHLVPLSLAWDGQRILVATPTESPTVRNARASGRVRAALDSADDVVLIEGTAEIVDFAAADGAAIEAYVGRVGWNPADQPGEWSMLTVTPKTIRAWIGVGEIQGRTIMRNGDWLL